mmetsp:Transcript_28214/g.62245  ORF Transcript_28214/g.62245 Transcript_28214/m.62245 type:complete len:350 (-) Transcript_28214:38-1087(-)
MALADRPAVYGLPQLPGRCVVAAADHQTPRFLIGSASVQQQNQVHVVTYQDTTNELTVDTIATHDGEIWSMAAHPVDTDVFATSGPSPEDPGVHKCRLWRIDGDTLEAVSELSADKPFKTIRSILWDSQNSNKMVVIDSENIRLFDGVCSSPSPITTIGAGTVAHCGCWDPHHANLLTVAEGQSLKSYDLRQSKAVHDRPNAHHFAVKAVDHNPNVQYNVVTGGEDAVMKFWDLRHLERPLQVLQGQHTHWITSVKFNPCHDQLVASSGTDCLVNLWHAPSVASIPLGGVDRKAKHQPDGCVKTSAEHEDSVYACCWSPADAFVLVSISYDGKIVLSHVPPDLKYSILL